MIFDNTRKTFASTPARVCSRGAYRCSRWKGAWISDPWEIGKASVLPGRDLTWFVGVRPLATTRLLAAGPSCWSIRSCTPKFDRRSFRTTETVAWDCDWAASRARAWKTSPRSSLVALVEGPILTWPMSHSVPQWALSQEAKRVFSVGW